MEGETSSKGALIGAIIVILLLVAGGIYVAVMKPVEEPVPAPTATTTTATTTATSSNELNAIDAHIEGFRSGHIPEKVLVQNVGESAVLYEMAERTLAAEYPGMLAEQNIDAIGRPEITITKLAKDNPLGFAIKTAVTPEVKLPDYHRIAEQEFAQEAEPVTVSNQEVESVLNELREARRSDGMELPASAAADDEFAHSVGKFDSLDELKTKIQENLQEEKEVKTRDKRRMRALEAILAQTPITVPRALVAAETEKMLAELRANIEH